MNKQHFHRPATNVAGRDFIQNNHPPSPDNPSLGPQKWLAKHYWFGKRMTSGWMAQALILLFFVSALLFITIQRFFSPGPMWFINVVLSVFWMAGLAVAAGTTGRVYKEGFVFICGTLNGFVKDSSGYIFFGKLGGKGTVCPKCRAQLVFQKAADLHSALTCQLNSAHTWPFDFTAVQDEDHAGT